MHHLVINNDITLELPSGAIGISFSGGVDSSLLAYLVLDQIKDTEIHLFTISTVQRNLCQHKVCADVLSEICRLTNNYNVIQHMSVCNSDAEGSSSINLLPDKMLYHQQIVKSVLYGTNCNPSATDIPGIDQFEFFYERQRSPLVTRPLSSNGIYRPLTNLTKQDIYGIYLEQGITESVYPLTKSCSTDYGQLPCGKCWFCLERVWGEQPPGPKPKRLPLTYSPI